MPAARSTKRGSKTTPDFHERLTVLDVWIVGTASQPHRRTRHAQRDLRTQAKAMRRCDQSALARERVNNRAEIEHTAHLGLAVFSNVLALHVVGEGDNLELRAHLAHEAAPDNADAVAPHCRAARAITRAAHGPWACREVVAAHCCDDASRWLVAAEHARRDEAQLVHWRSSASHVRDPVACLIKLSHDCRPRLSLLEFRRHLEHVDGGITKHEEIRLCCLGNARHVPADVAHAARGDAARVAHDFSFEQPLIQLLFSVSFRREVCTVQSWIRCSRAVGLWPGVWTAR